MSNEYEGFLFPKPKHKKTTEETWEKHDKH